MIHDEICTYEVCMLAKEKGFPQDPKENNNDQIYCWDNLRKIHTLCSCAMWYIGEYSREDMYAAPTQSLLHRWLRKEHNFYIDVGVWEDFNEDADGKCVCTYPYWSFNILSCFTGDLIYEEFEHRYDTYELALEDALAYVLKNLV